MSKVIKLTENDLLRIIKKVIKEQETNMSKTFQDYDFALYVFKKEGFKLNPEKTKARLQIKDKQITVSISKVKCSKYPGIDIFVNDEPANAGEECPEACWIKLSEILGKKISINQKIMYSGIYPTPS